MFLSNPFQKWMEDQAQKLVDATARAFAGSQVRSALASRPLLGAPMMPTVQQVAPMRAFGAFPAPGGVSIYLYNIKAFLF